MVTVISSSAKSVVASLEVKVSASEASLDVNPSAPSAAVIVIVGTVWSFKVILALIKPAQLPAISYIQSAKAAAISSTSLPSGVPERGMSNVYTLPLAEILEGVLLDKVAVPPLMENQNCDASMAPLPLLVLYTASLNVTAKVLLSEDTETPVI